MASLSDKQRDLCYLIEDNEPITTPEISNAIDVSQSGVRSRIDRARKHGADITWTEEGYMLTAWPEDEPADPTDTTDDAEEPAPTPDIDDVDVLDDAEADPEDLTDRERVIVSELQTGTTLTELQAEIEEREPVVNAHLRELKRRGWKLYVDDTTSTVGIEGDTALRSSEHKGTRTRKANRWWELTHNALVRRYRELEPPVIDTEATPGREDWVTHMTDLHAGDIVRGYDDEEIIHRTEDLPTLVDYITEQSIRLSRKHGSEYDTAALLWGGDMVTNNGIYEGQFEDLDAWLDEQVDVVMGPLLRQIKTFAGEFDAVRVVCQAGNHGDVRASGSSKQANADLILYKAIRNTLAALQDEGLYQNVSFKVGRAGSPTVFRLRDGAIHGQLRHGQDRSPQFDTSARQKEWLSTVLDSLNVGDMVDMVWMGHHHVSGRLPWQGPPVIITGSPKPGGEFPRKLGLLSGPQRQKVATVHGVSDDGITSIWPVDTRDYPS